MDGDLVYVDANDTDTDRVVRYWRSGDFALHKFYWGWMPPHPTFLYEERSMKGAAFSIRIRAQPLITNLC